MDLAERMLDIGKRAKAASREIAKADGQRKKDALELLAVTLLDRSEDILAANRRDVEAAEAKGLDAPKLERLRLTEKSIEGLARACREVAAIPDPVGEIETMWQRPSGLMVGRMRVPLGVICMIFESRPGVIVESSILCLTAGNAVILRGGSEAFHSNTALASAIHIALDGAGLPADCVQTMPTTDREAVTHLLKMSDYIDVVIPRGGEGLIRKVVEQATMPVLKHYKGVCHLYVDEGADLREALMIADNAKTQRPGVCNALECALVNEKEAAEFLPLLAEKLASKGVAFRACPKSLPLLGATASPAAEDDWGREFLDLILAVKVVPDMDEAMDHIARYGSNHTEVICTRDHRRAMRFLREADASMVAVNASTRFNDGGELGLGAEIGISTTKLHAYGPMGVKELTSAKYVVLGQGQVRT